MRVARIRGSERVLDALDVQERRIREIASYPKEQAITGKRYARFEDGHATASADVIEVSLTI